MVVHWNGKLDVLRCSIIHIFPERGCPPGSSQRTSLTCIRLCQQTRPGRRHPDASIAMMRRARGHARPTSTYRVSSGRYCTATCRALPIRFLKRIFSEDRARAPALQKSSAKGPVWTRHCFGRRFRSGDCRDPRQTQALRETKQAPIPASALPLSAAVRPDCLAHILCGVWVTRSLFSKPTVSPED